MDRPVWPRPLDTEGNDTKKGAGFAMRAAKSPAVAEAKLRRLKAVLVPGRGRTDLPFSVIRTLCIASGNVPTAPRHDFAPACDAQVLKMMARLLAMPMLLRPLDGLERQ
jgi:hypothetical protein